MNANDPANQTPFKPVKLAYRGPVLYERLVEHARKKGDEYTSHHSSPDERMEMLARRIDNLDENLATENALYEVSIWILICKRTDDFENHYCPRLLATAAQRGHESARFVTAKACLDGIPWAVSELRRLSRNGNPFELARTWLKGLSDNGYADARMELGSDLWERGYTAEAYETFLSVTDCYPNALVRLGIHQLAEEPEAAVQNLDKGESLEPNDDGLSQLEQALART
jgi:hypothetical protein